MKKICVLLVALSFCMGQFSIEAVASECATMTSVATQGQRYRVSAKMRTSPHSYKSVTIYFEEYNGGYYVYRVGDETLETEISVRGSNHSSYNYEFNYGGKTYYFNTTYAHSVD